MKIETDTQTVPGEIIRDGQHGYVLWRELPTLDAAFTLKGSDANKKAGHAQSIKVHLGQAKPSSWRDDPEWDGGISTVAKAKALATSGWPEGVLRLKGAAKQVKTSPAVSIRRKKRMGAEGDMVDPHKLISGQLDTAWESRKREARPATRTVTLWCELTTSCMKTASQMMWRGIAATAATQLLEQAGYRVRVKGYNQLKRLVCSGPKKGPTLLVFTAKKPEEALNAARLCYLLAHSSAYRTLGFLYKRSLPWAVNSGLGIVDYGPPRAGVMGPNDLCISDVWTKDRALEWLKASIAKIDGNTR